MERIVDLCAAPGSWSQVCRKKLEENGFFGPDDKVEGYRIVSIDLQDVTPISNVFHIVGDITKGETLEKVLEAFSGRFKRYM